MADSRITDLETAVEHLAACYRESGAFTEGHEDWRLAPRALKHVRRLREEHDECVEEACRYLRVINRVAEIVFNDGDYRDPVLEIAELVQPVLDSPGPADA